MLTQSLATLTLLNVANSFLILYQSAWTTNQPIPRTLSRISFSEITGWHLAFALTRIHVTVTGNLARNAGCMGGYTMWCTGVFPRETFTSWLPFYVTRHAYNDTEQQTHFGWSRATRWRHGSLHTSWSGAWKKEDSGRRAWPGDGV